MGWLRRRGSSSLQGEGGLRCYLFAANSRLAEFLEDSPASKESMLGVGILFPGIVELEKKEIINSHALNLHALPFLLSCPVLFSGFNTAIYAIIPDCVEYGEWKTGCFAIRFFACAANEISYYAPSVLSPVSVKYRAYLINLSVLQTKALS